MRKAPGANRAARNATTRTGDTRWDESCSRCGGGRHVPHNRRMRRDGNDAERMRGAEQALGARASAAIRAGAGSPRGNPNDRRRLGVPIGGAGVRLWAKVTNPNPFTLTVATLKGTLFLEDARAADVDFPLGLPLAAGGETTVPIDLTISFANLPGLADSVRRAISRQPLAYRLEG